MSNIPFLSFPQVIEAARHQITSAAMPEPPLIYHLAEICRIIDTLPPTLDRCLILTRFLMWRNQPEAAEKSAQRGLSLAAKKSEQAIAIYMKGWVCERTGLYQQAIPFLEEAVLLSGHNRVVRAHAYNRLGWCHVYLRNFSPAENNFQKAREVNIGQTTAANLRGLAAIANRLRQCETARSYVKEAQAADPTDEINQLLCQLELGSSARFEDSYNAALGHYQQAIALAAARRDPGYLATAYTALAESLNKADQPARARQAIYQALRLSPYISRRFHVAERLKILAAIEQRYARGLTGEEAARAVIRANTAIEQGLALVRDMADKRLEADFHFQRGLLEMGQQRWLAAMTAFSQSSQTRKRIPPAEQTEEDQTRLHDVLTRFEMLTSAMNGAVRIDGQTPVLTGAQLEIGTRFYSDWLYNELLNAFEKLKAEERRFAPAPLAQMLATLQGEWFKNYHYSLLGYNWPTVSQHLRILVSCGVLEKRGHTKSAEYRLRSDFCPLMPQPDRPDQTDPAGQAIGPYSLSTGGSVSSSSGPVAPAMTKFDNDETSSEIDIVISSILPSVD